MNKINKNQVKIYKYNSVDLESSLLHSFNIKVFGLLYFLNKKLIVDLECQDLTKVIKCPFIITVDNDLIPIEIHC